MADSVTFQFILKNEDRFYPAQALCPSFLDATTWAKMQLTHWGLPDGKIWAMLEKNKKGDVLHIKDGLPVFQEGAL